MTHHTPLSRRQLLRGAGVGAAGLLLPSSLLAACSSAEGSGSGGGAGKGKGGATGTIEFWIDIAGEPNQKYFDEKVIGAFEKAKQDIDVKVTYYKGADLRRLIQTALQAQSGPDVVRGPSSTQTLAWSKANVLADLSSYRDQWSWDDKILNWAMEAFTTDGKLWALPMRVDTLLLYTNATLFEDKGWSTPTNRDDLEALAEEAAGQGITPFGASNVDWKAASEWHMSAFWNHFSGPEAVYQALTGETSFSDPVFVDAVALIKNYFDKGWFGGGVDKYFSVPSQEIGANFGKGTVAMVPQGVWWMSGIKQYFGEKAGNSNDWDWIPWPALSSHAPEKVFDLGIGGSLAVNAHSDKQDAAAEYLNWYYGDKDAALQRMADVPATYNIPIQYSADDIPSSIDPRSGRVLTGLADAVDTGNYGYVTWTWWPPKADTFVFEGLEKVLTGGSSPKEYCEQLADIFEQERKAGNVPQIPQRTGAA